MVKRIHNVDKWALYKPTDFLSFEGMPGRRIEIDFNTEAKARVHLVGETGNTFLAVIDGMERLEFVTSEAIVDLAITSEGEVWYFSNEGQEAAVSRPDAISYVKMMTRRVRNPELERMMFDMRQNEMRREEILRSQTAQFAAWQAARDADVKAAAEAEAKAKADGEVEAKADAE